MEEVKPWNEEKKQYRGLTIGFLILFLVAFAKGPNPQLDELHRIDNLVTKLKPYYGERGVKGRQYYTEFRFHGKSDKYELSGSDYQYADHKAIKKDLNVEDTVTIYTREGLIYALIKNGKDYCNLYKANGDRNENFILLSVFTLVGFTTGNIILFLKKEPKVHPTLILVLSLVLTSILLSYFIGCESMIDKDYS